MLKNELHKIIDTIVRKEKRYNKEAYKFVNAAVNFTVTEKKTSGHVAAGELLDGITRFALNEFSVFYVDIFKSWGINDARDIGNIVYALISSKVLGASPEDSIEDFNIDFDLFAPACETQPQPDKENIKVPQID
jgi:uncharacterized repeat protein (TIGR04138 family)